MTAVSEGKSRDVPSRRFAGRREGRRVKRGGERERGEKRLSPLIPTIPRRPVPDFRARRNERRTRGEGGDGDGGWDAPDGKKRAGALLPAHERTKETIVEYEVEYKLSSGDRARNQSTSCPALLLPPPPPLLCLFALFPPIVFFIPNFTRRHATLG